jgi:poly-beta-1,6-N-acetyl-D-glucosamine synthase
MNYVLITAARNEAAMIKSTIESVVAQTVRPLRWVIVDDGSTDRTAEIVEAYVPNHQWIELVRRPARQHRTFAGKVHAFNAGFERIACLQPDLVGNLDADISFSPDHFEFLIGKLTEDPALGVVGTAYTEEGWDSTQDSFEGATSVHGACQLFRYECFMEIGGYVPHRSGGIDWIAVTTARMKGWKTRNFPDRWFHHHRTMGTAERSPVGAMFDYGKKDYFLGGSPLWQVCRVGYRMAKKPLIVGGLALGCGYCWAAVRRMERPVSPELMRFHRREQMAKLRAIVRSIVSLEQVDKFNLPLGEQAAPAPHAPGKPRVAPAGNTGGSVRADRPTLDKERRWSSGE